METDRQAGRQTDRQTDRQTLMNPFLAADELSLVLLSIYIPYKLTRGKVHSAIYLQGN